MKCAGTRGTYVIDLMEWPESERTKYYADSNAGYRILFIRKGDDWLYLVYGPSYTVGRDDLEARYEIGDQVPVGREFIGSWINDPAAAKQACDDHWGRLNDKQAQG